MKKITLFFACYSLICCNAIQQISNQEIVTKNGCEQLSFDGKTPLFPLEIDNKNTIFVFDTGAMTSALIDTTIIQDFSKKDFSRYGGIKGADGKKVSNKRFTASVKSTIFESNNKVLSFINMPSSECKSKSRSYSGILGLDVFFEKNEILQLDFSTNKVCLISASQLQEFLLNKDYKPIRSKCRWNQIFIYFSLEGKEYEFHLDTGYTGNIIMPYDDKLDIKNENKIELEGSLYQTISSHTNGKEIIYEKMPIVFATQGMEAKVNVSTSIKAQNIGIEFIKCFDWLFDYNHNKVYVKRNQNPIESAFKRKVMYYAKVNAEKLEIVIKEKSQTKFNLGDEIISVNGQKVTAENQCELQDLLNKTEDWNSFQLEVISNSK
jgi:hypothetical protein